MLVDSIDELDMYEAEKRLALYNEYRDAIRVFQYYVETELRAYLCNGVDVEAGCRTRRDVLQGHAHRHVDLRGRATAAVRSRSGHL